MNKNYYAASFTKKFVENDKELYTFIVSSDHIDRVGDKMNVSGIDLSEYKRNPIVLRNHEGKAIGTAKNIYVQDNKLLADTYFDEITPESRETKAMIDAGTLKTASIGFEPIEMKERDLREGDEVYTKSRPWITRINEIAKSIMLEFSIVDLPANIYAEIQRGLNKGIDVTHLQAQYKQLTNREGEMNDEVIMEFKCKGNEVDTLKRFKDHLDNNGYEIVKAGATISKTNMGRLNSIIENANMIKESATKETDEEEKSFDVEQAFKELVKEINDVKEYVKSWEAEAEIVEEVDEENVIELKEWRKMK